MASVPCPEDRDKQKPERRPQHTQHRRNQKGSAKSVALRQKHNQRRGESGANHAAAIENTDGQRSLARSECRKIAFMPPE